MTTVELGSTKPKPKRSWLTFAMELAVIAAVVTMLIVLLTTETVAVADTEFQLTITPVSKSGRHVTSLLWATTNDGESANAIARNSIATPEVEFRGAERQDNHFVANVSYSARIVNGVVSAKHVPHFVVVAVTYDDGKSVREVAELRPGTRSVSVALP